MNTTHFICTVTDSLNNIEISCVYCDYSTQKKAEKFFRNHKDVKKYLGNERYDISFRANAVILQDSTEFLKEWKKRK